MTARPYLVGLTGSIGMGKTETAKMFAELGVPVYDADAAVHRLYEKGGAAVPEIEKLFPHTVEDGRVNREKLAKEITAIPDGFKKLEAIVHPLVARARAQARRHDGGKARPHPLPPDARCRKASPGPFRGRNRQGPRSCLQTGG